MYPGGWRRAGRDEAFHAMCCHQVTKQEGNDYWPRRWHGEHAILYYGNQRQGRSVLSMPWCSSIEQRAESVERPRALFDCLRALLRTAARLSIFFAGPARPARRLLKALLKPSADQQSIQGFFMQSDLLDAPALSSSRTIRVPREAGRGQRSPPPPPPPLPLYSDVKARHGSSSRHRFRTSNIRPCFSIRLLLSPWLFSLY